MRDLGMFLKTCRKGEVGRERRARRRNFHAGLTLVELLVLVAILAILAGMIPVSFTSARPKAQRIKCVNNLKNVGVAFHIYAESENGLFPWESTNSTGAVRSDFSKGPEFYFRAMKNELSTPRLVVCPSDSRTEAKDWTNFSAIHVSYLIGEDGAKRLPESLLAGDRNMMTNGVPLKTGIQRIESGADVRWDKTQHEQQGNAVLGDGSVRQLSSSRLKEQFKNSGLTNITLAIP